MGVGGGGGGLPQITWRPIRAQSASVLPRWKLRIAARALTCFRKCLANEATGSFLHLSIKGVAGWMRNLNEWGCTIIGEADCKDQFNCILPSDVLNHFREATEWLCSQRRWRATQMFWFIHKYDKCLDRCGKASTYKFDILSHAELTQLIEFCPQDDSFCMAAGTCWSQALPYPWVGRLAPRQRTYTVCGHFICTNSASMPWTSYFQLMPGTPSGLMRQVGLWR